VNSDFHLQRLIITVADADMIFVVNFYSLE